MLVAGHRLRKFDEILRFSAINKHRSSSEIRRRSLVTSRPNALKQKTRDQSSSSGESIDIENDYTFPPIDQLIELAPSPTEPEVKACLVNTLFSCLP